MEVLTHWSIQALLWSHIHDGCSCSQSRAGDFLKPFKHTNKTCMIFIKREEDWYFFFFNPPVSEMVAEDLLQVHVIY